MKKDYLVTIHGLSSAPRRLGFARWQIVAAAVTLVVGALVVAVSLVVVVRAQGRVHALSAVGDEQQRRLETIGKQAQSLDDELRRLQTQNQQIRRLLGVDRMPAAHARPAQHPEQTTMNGNATDRVAGRLTSLVTASQVTRADADHLRHIALRVLNIHRMQELLQARVIAAVPSIDPVEGASIASAFGWRIDPWPSFHAGVDLDANYGDEVRAAAAGTVVSAGW
ncbi:MAG: hypothetical protein JO060_09825, partial [Candidatus Eremiobacteraeota bacterium]|nr:hypothetical protein [Candidatus Eremiobacteraeota bacterium]